ncbi:hypothetical protein M8994_15560 [Brucella sp. 21LCYQ03]|nr:hypothetical protein [Brucella sp. 21LCYQ03]
MSSKISMIATNGARITYGDGDDDHVFENDVIVYGPGGTYLSCDVSPYASIYYNNVYQPTPYNVTLRNDEITGLSYSKFKVRFTPPQQAREAMQLTIVNVSAFDTSAPDEEVTKSPSFESNNRACDVHYIDGYNLISGAPADGTTSCKLTIFISDEAAQDGIKQIMLTLDENSKASIVGSEITSHGKQKIANIPKTNMVRFDIVSRAPDHYMATLNVVDSSYNDTLIIGDGQNPPFAFVALPPKV